MPDRGPIVTRLILISQQKESKLTLQEGTFSTSVGVGRTFIFASTSVEESAVSGRFETGRFAPVVDVFVPGGTGDTASGTIDEEDVTIFVMVGFAGGGGFLHVEGETGVGTAVFIEAGDVTIGVGTIGGGGSGEALIISKGGEAVGASGGGLMRSGGAEVNFHVGEEVFLHEEGERSTVVSSNGSGGSSTPGGILFIEVVGIHFASQTDLLEVVGAGNSAGLFTGGVEGRQKHAGEDRDDGDHDEELDQGEAARFHFFLLFLFFVLFYCRVFPIFYFFDQLLFRGFSILCVPDRK